MRHLLSLALLLACAAPALAQPKLKHAVEGFRGPAVLIEGGEAILSANSKEGKPLWITDLEGKRLTGLDPKGADVPTQEALVVDPSGKLAASASTTKLAIYVWDLEKKVLLQTLEHKAKGFGIQALAFGPKGKLLVSGALGGAVVWDAKKGKRKGTYAAHVHPQSRDGGSFLNSISISPKGLVATGEDDHAIHVWPLSSRKAKVRIPVSRRGSAAAFGPKGKVVLVGCMGGTLALWKGGKTRELPTAHRDGITAIALFDKGRKALSADESGNVVCWSLGSLKKSWELKADSGPICSLQVEGKTLLTASRYGGVKTWTLR